MKPETQRKIDQVFAEADADFKRRCDALLEPLTRPPIRTICGMIPWMFWTLLIVTVFALTGPEIAWTVRHILK